VIFGRLSLTRTVPSFSERRTSMVKSKPVRVTPGKPKRRANIGELLNRVNKFERNLSHAHSKLVKLVNEVVIPNLNSLHSQFKNLNTIFARHVVILHILQERSGGITNAEFDAAQKHLFDVSQKNSLASRVQSAKAGSAEDSGGHERSNVLDDAVTGEHAGSDPDEQASEATSPADSESTTDSTSED